MNAKDPVEEPEVDDIPDPEAKQKAAPHLPGSKPILAEVLPSAPKKEQAYGNDAIHQHMEQTVSEDLVLNALPRVAGYEAK
jgi:hypothetical protein